MDLNHWLKIEMIIICHFTTSFEDLMVSILLHFLILDSIRGKSL